MDEFFRDAIDNCQESWRHVIATAVTLGIPTPAFSAALAFYDGFRSEMLPANLIQVNFRLYVYISVFAIFFCHLKNIKSVTNHAVYFITFKCSYIEYM